MDAHKGTRKKLVIVGGARGMAGAPVIAARGAFRSSVGVVKLVVAAESLPVVQKSESQALAAEWPADDAAVEREIATWADVVVIGPGLGRGDDSRALLERVLGRWHGPVLLDADAITLFEGRVDRLAELLAGRPALLTPHPVEFWRLSRIPVKQVLAGRFDVGLELARRLQATVLLKGVPTVITAPDGQRLVSAAGTPVLATGGSGDLLCGIAGTLFAQIGDPFVAGALSAYAHGCAAEWASERGVRGVTLENVIAEVSDVWNFCYARPRYPVLTELDPFPRRLFAEAEEEDE
jgi:NAD(P)H-hydrate epimerase